MLVGNQVGWVRSYADAQVGIWYQDFLKISNFQFWEIFLTPLLDVVDPAKEERGGFLGGRLSLKGGNMVRTWVAAAALSLLHFPQAPRGVALEEVKILSPPPP